jgi:hypothetical protein
VTDTHDQSTGKKTAGAFDIRVIISMLIGLYGVVLVVSGLVATSDADLDTADGVNINLWAGLGMVVVALAFVVWARLRPIVVAVPDEEQQQSGH